MAITIDDVHQLQIKNAKNGDFNLNLADETARNQIEDLNQDLEVQTARIDNILTQGTPTEGNAELIDIRVGADGTIYPTAGDAVRGQIEDVEGRLDIVEDVIGINQPIGNVYNVTGTSINTSATRLTFSGAEGDTIEIALSGTSWITGSKCFVYIRYDGDSDDTLLGAIDYPAVSATYTLAHDTVSVAIYARNLTDGTIGYSVSSATQTGLIGDIANITDQLDTITQDTETMNENARIALYDKCFERCRFVNHLGTPYYNGLVIPCQSRFDIERASRAGFVAMEFNNQKTSDNKYIVTHGCGGKFGTEFYSLDGTDITNVSFSEKTLAWIKENVRFNSALDKYKVAPLSLEEALICAKQNGLVPVISYLSSTPDVIEIADSILGKWNYVLSIYSNDRPSGFGGVCSSWLTIADVDELVAKCDASGGAYVAGINASNSAYSSFTLDDWKAMVDAVHDKGYRISSAYITDPNLQRTLEKAGFDYIFSAYQVPTISRGNICSLRDHNTFTDFTHQGTVTDGRLVLTDGQTVIPSESLTARVSSGGSLGVAFIGTIKINLGTYISQIYSFTSTDASEMWNFSTYFNGAVPTFTITAVGNVTISELYYDASEY